MADIGTRVRLTQSQHVSAYARLSDGRVLLARREITVTAGGCGL
ncbi:thiosulfate oxidation carrier protein SoxY [Paracoccus sp. DMF-8]|nr:thiosulfate oxidation carrier protein SoxY [Paracoccus sp. DMF-8]MDF3607471.1 thiosulfate oxidation carrier protein SoxY [Paracoccus sp. DMF-8]